MTRRLLLAALAPALVAASLGLTGCAGLGIPISVPSTTDPDPAASSPVIGGLVGQLPPWDDAFAMTVVEIVDGDTVRAAIDRSNDVVTTTNPISVRLVGIDTPETYPDEECFGPEAQDALATLIPVGTTVLVAPDVDSWDDYNRRLFYMWTEDELFVNGILALGGYADVRSYPPNTTLQDELQAAEDDAKANDRGLWAAC